MSTETVSSLFFFVVAVFGLQLREDWQYNRNANLRERLPTVQVLPWIQAEHKVQIPLRVILRHGFTLRLIGKKRWRRKFNVIYISKYSIADFLAGNFKHVFIQRRVQKASGFHM